MSDSNFSDAFKRHTLSLLHYGGHTLHDVSRQTGVTIDTLETWNQEINLLEGLSTAETATLLIPSDSVQNISNTATQSSTVLGEWFGLDQINTLHESQLDKVEWHVPSYDHPSPLLARGRLLGEGGMGRVITGLQASTGREVAIKEIKEGLASKSITRRLLQEAWITGLLEHPNIVPIYTIEANEDGLPMILMKRISGRTWSEYIHNPEIIPNAPSKHERLKWHLHILSEVSLAMQYAHDKGIIHRDLKPDNVMIGEYGEVYVLDWGIAVAIDDRYESWIPRADDLKGIAGTPAYMAPEMLQGGELSIQSDLYLLGAILWEIIEGTPPHQQTPLAELKTSIQHFQPTPSHECPNFIRTLLERTLQASPTKRLASTTEFVQQVTNAQHLLDVQKIIDSVNGELEGLNQALTNLETSRKIIYAHFIAARFGINQIPSTLDVSNLRIRYQNTVLGLCTWELNGNRPTSAELLLADLNDPPQSLIDEIEQSKALIQAEKERLRLMDIDQSETIGIRTRAFVIILAIVGWMTFPTWQLITGIEFGYRHLFIQTVCVQLWMFCIGFWARESLSATEVNRRTFSILLGEPLFHTVSDLCAYSAGWEAHDAWVLRFLVWNTMLLSYGMLMEFKMLPVAFVYSLLSITVFLIPEYVSWISIGINILLLISMGIIWHGKIKQAEDARTIQR